MELEQIGAEKPRPMTYDEASMERSKSFVKALQELKNLRPQLYSAAEYCEKSYFHSEQKQMVLDNLKDYAVRALVNAVDHLGTVAYKLTDLLDQHAMDISSMELKITCINQQLLTCQTFTEKEGLRQQQLLAIIPRHHKHYTLPNAVNKKVHFSPQIQMDPRQQVHVKPRLYPSGTPAAKTLSWHLASETKSSLKGTHRASLSSEDSKSSGKSSIGFNLLDAEQSGRIKSPKPHSQLPSVGPASTVAIKTLGISRLDAVEGSKPMTPFRSFGNTTRQEIVRVPARSKSVLSAFFVKQKTQKLKASAMS
ncbi:protein ABIL1-like isoform X2 [Coffea arabica]|uniref:Protein ABIL1-like isoform X2 n=1 Tax=Coffea arabica TaxID=13443 RepID=A0A6P6WIL1_COFAR|nr:protein ABIL1-like isoform X2 [Coffea arabica]